MRFLLLILIVEVLCQFGQSFRRISRHGNIHISPLDAENGERQAEFAGGLVPLNPESLIPDQATMDRLPLCQHACNTAFSNAIKVALQASNHHERFLGVCRHYNETIICQDRLVGCPGRDAFDVLTSGLYYMCIDQRKAFDKVIECLDAKSTEVQKECEAQCNGQKRLSDWAGKSGLFNLFSRGENFLQQIEPENLRLMMHDVCDLINCYLTCIRTSYNTKCGDNAGTLLSEAIVRPVAETQADPFVKSISTIMYVFVPQQCSFFVIEEALASHRIDPKTDEELRRAAIEEKMTTQNVTSTTIKQNVTSTLTTILSTKTTILNQTTTLKPKIPPANEKHTKTEDLSKKKANEAPRVVQNATAIVGMNHYDPIDIIDIGEKWGFDIGIDN